MAFHGDLTIRRFSLSHDRFPQADSPKYLMFSTRQFELPPDTLSGPAREFLHGAYKLDGALLLALDVDDYWEFGEQWSALTQALAGAVAEGVEVPGDLLEEFAADLDDRLAAGSLSRDRTDMVAASLERLGRPLQNSDQ